MRIDYYIFGYRVAKIKKEDIERAATALMRKGLSFCINPSGELIIPSYRLRCFRTALSGIEYSLSTPMGLFRGGKSVKPSLGALLGVALSAMLLILASDFVFDIRIESSEGVSRETVAEALYDAGFEVGDRWSRSELDKIEGLVMLNNPSVGFISINRRGSCAYVSVSAKSEGADTVTSGRCNIIAKYDCVIEEITVKSGVAAVKAGDTVRAGDLLISGVIPQELGGGIVAASGVVRGRVSEKISLEVSRSETVREYLGERLVGINVNILGFSVNIFKNYGNLPMKYDIIKSEEVLLTPNGVKLPISIVKTYAEPYTDATVEYSDSELSAIAMQRHRESLDKILDESEMLKISTRQEFTDGGCLVFSDMLLLTDVGVKRSIE